MSYFRRLLTIGMLLLVTTIMSFALKAEYRFEKCDGSATLESHVGSGLNGSLSGDANISLGDGKILNALMLSGDGMMSVEHSTDLDLVDNLTIAFWIKPSKIKKQALVTRGLGSGTNRKYASNAEFFIKMNDDGKLAYRHNFVTNSSTVAYSDQNLSVNKWTHVVFTRDNSLKTMRFYINGIANSEYTYTNEPQSSHSEKLIFGYCDGCVNPSRFSGKLDEIKIYNIALNGADVAELYDIEKSGGYSTGGCHPAPIAVNDSADLPFAGAITVDVLANDRANDSATCFVDASTVMITSSPVDANLSDDKKTLVVANEGNWSVDCNGSISFISNSTFLGNPTDINYTVSDSCANLSNEATVTLTRVANGGGDGGSSSGGGSGGSSGSSWGGGLLSGGTTPPVEDKNITLGDKVWHDVNRNGIQDSGEEGVADVIVVLFNADGSVADRTVTDANGIYHFYDVSEGSYTIGFSNLPENYIFTTLDMGSSDAKDSDVDSSGRTAEFTVGNVENDLIYDAGIVSPIDQNITIRPSIDDNTTEVIDDCKCDDYKSTIPSISRVGRVAILLLISLLGVLFLRKEELFLNIK